MTNHNKPWGQHLVIDIKGCDPDTLRDKNVIMNFVEELLRTIDMKPYGDTILEHFANNDYAASGFTLVQLIETSSITAHFAENIGSAFFDIFSCRAFSDTKVEEVVRKHFKPTRATRQTLWRGQ